MTKVATRKASTAAARFFVATGSSYALFAISGVEVVTAALTAASIGILFVAVTAVVRLATRTPGPAQDESPVVPDLEAMLPTRVADRALATWSLRGAELYRTLFGATDADIAAHRSELADVGAEIDDVEVAVAGRQDPSADPPYLIEAWRSRGVTAADVPLADSVAFPERGRWATATWEGREVVVGTASMLVQDEHQRGRPYIYDVGDVRFIVKTDDDDWAAEAISLLPLPSGPTRVA